MSGKVTVRDQGANALLKAVKRKPSFDVGIIGKNAAKKHEGAKRVAPLAAIATYQEFGTKTIPPRPFISGWFDKNKGESYKLLRALSAKLMLGRISTEQFVNLFGNRAVGGIKKFIASKIPPPLAASTLAKRARKGRAAARARAIAKGKTPSKIKRRKKGAPAQAGNATPLIDTGLLRSSITFRLNRLPSK